MKCAFIKCKNEHNGSKQFNDAIIRLYCCTKHLIVLADLYIWDEKVVKLLEG